MESIILNSPLLLLLYGAAILMCIFDFIKRNLGYIFPMLSAVIFVGATIYALLLGAGYVEISNVILIFLALNLSLFLMHKWDKK